MARSKAIRGAAALLGMVLAAVATTGMAAPKIERWETANGARVLYVQAPELPMVDVRVMFDAGSVRDGDQGGLAMMTNALLAEGAGDLDADAIAERFEDLGAHFGNGADRESAYISLRSLSDAAVLDPALDTAALVLRSPRFAEADIERERQRLLVSLRGQEASPGAIASKAFYRAIYGDHPYAAPPQGTRESVTALSRSDLARFQRQYYVARNAVVAIVGDVDRARAEAIAERLVGGLPAGEAAPALPPVPALAEGKTIRIPFPSKQTHIVIGQPGMRRGEADYFALYVANHVLGGSGLVSRLNEEIREKRGLSYSVYSYFAPMRQYGPFQTGLQTRSDQADEALRVMRETLAGYLAEGPSTEELEASKRNITGGFPLNIDSNGKIVGYLGMIGFYNLPLDYLDRFPGRIEALTRDQVHRAIRERLDPERMVTVIVGGNG